VLDIVETILLNDLNTLQVLCISKFLEIMDKIKKEVAEINSKRNYNPKVTIIYEDS